MTILPIVGISDVEYGLFGNATGHSWWYYSQRGHKNNLKSRRCAEEQALSIKEGSSWQTSRGTAETREMTLPVKQLIFRTSLGPWVIASQTACSLKTSAPASASACQVLLRLTLFPCPLAHSSNAGLPFPSPSHTNFDGSGTIQISCF